MNGAFTLPFRLGDCRKSFLPLDWHCSSGLQAPFRRERKQLSERSIVILDSARELRRPLRRKFLAEIERDTTRTIASPQRAFFPWQLAVRKFTDLPDCTLGMCPENEREDSRLGLLSGSMCKKRTQCATSCCGQGFGKVLAQVFTRKHF